MHAVRLQTLTKDFRVGFWRPRPKRAIDRVTLDVAPGEVLGYLGPNGSGKTTTLKLLMQLIFPTSGSAEILGRPAGDLDVRRRVGFLPENPYFYDNLTAEELLRYFAGLCGCNRQEADRRTTTLLDRVGIGDERRLHLRKYSKGMLQRIGIAQALVNDPEVVFLDEPMSGLDPLGRRDVRQLLLSLRDEGRTLFFSSHILSDAEAICSRVAILSQGRLIASGKVSELGLRVRGWELVVTGISASLAKSLIPTAESMTCIADGRYAIELPPHSPPELAITTLVGNGAQILSLNPQHETLEEFFVDQVTRQRDQDEGQRASA
jgi:ABC-2 type transport system ATP-binding protein